MFESAGCGEARGRKCRGRHGGRGREMSESDSESCSLSAATVLGSNAQSTGRMSIGEPDSVTRTKMMHSRPTSKEDALKHYEKHQIVNMLEQITADLAINQPADPRRYIYDMLGQTLGLESSPEAHCEVKFSSLRLFLEYQTPSVKITKESSHSVPHAGISDQVLATWRDDFATWRNARIVHRAIFAK
jgi:hypothetical protein